MGVRCNRRLAGRVQGPTLGSADLARARRGRAGLIRADYNQIINSNHTNHHNGRLLAHPRVMPEGPHRMVYQQPVFGVSTAAYTDVDKFLDAVRAFHVDHLGHKVVGVVGDWQTFNRMWHCLLYTSPSPRD